MSDIKLTEQELKRIKNMFPDQEIEAIKVTNEGDRKHVSIFIKGFVSELHTHLNHFLYILYDLYFLKSVDFINIF